MFLGLISLSFDITTHSTTFASEHYLTVTGHSGVCRDSKPMAR